MTGLKKCTCCGEEKDLSMFSPRKNRPSGYASRCKKCSSKDSRKCVLANFTNEELAAKRREHRQARPDLAKAAYQRYRDGHPEYCKKSAESIRRWCRENPERFAESKRNWQTENSDLNRLKTANYRAKRRQNGGRLSRGIDKLLMSEQGARCPYCPADLRESGYNLDHYIPVNLGGPNEDWNIQLTCPTCNQKKSDKHPLAFIGLEIPNESMGPSFQLRWDVHLAGRLDAA